MIKKSHVIVECTGSHYRKEDRVDQLSKKKTYGTLTAVRLKAMKKMNGKHRNKRQFAMNKNDCSRLHVTLGSVL